MKKIYVLFIQAAKSIRFRINKNWRTTTRDNLEIEVYLNKYPYYRETFYEKNENLKKSNFDINGSDLFERSNKRTEVIGI
jgi:hypothetical protein